MRPLINFIKICMPNKLRHAINRWRHKLWKHIFEPPLHKKCLVHIVYYPPVTTQSDLDDQYYRALWYLHPLAKQVKTITMITKGDMRPSPNIPPLLDPAIAKFDKEMAPKFKFISTENPVSIKNFLKKADAVLLTKPTSKELISTLPNKKHFHVIDHKNEKESDPTYLYLSAKFMGSNKADIEDCKARFCTVVEKMRAPIGYILGTGPLLAELSDHDYSDGNTIACNTMVKNEALMERLQPKLIVMADPIFHAGCSVFAGELREHLVRAMKKYDADLLVPWRDYRLYRANLAPELKDRIIGIPYIYAGQEGDANLDLIKNYAVTNTANILTLFLLPLAATMFDTIRIGGCDGRPLSENNYFWKHDPSSQLTDRMDDIKAAHPAFFNMSYDDYYQQHCKILARWLDAIEAKGKHIENITPSYIPSLAARETKAALHIRKKIDMQK